MEHDRGVVEVPDRDHLDVSAVFPQLLCTQNRIIRMDVDVGGPVVQAKGCPRRPFDCFVLPQRVEEPRSLPGAETLHPCLPEHRHRHRWEPAHDLIGRVEPVEELPDETGCIVCQQRLERLVVDPRLRVCDVGEIGAVARRMALQRPWQRHVRPVTSRNTQKAGCQLRLSREFRPVRDATELDSVIYGEPPGKPGDSLGHAQLQCRVGTHPLHRDERTSRPLGRRHGPRLVGQLHCSACDRRPHHRRGEQQTRRCTEVVVPLSA